MTLKTLTDVMNSIPYEEVSRTRIADELRKEAIRWLKNIIQKQEEHWNELNEKGYLKMENPYSWDLEDLHFSDWHEASDPEGAIMILKHFFNITEEELK